MKIRKKTYRKVLGIFTFSSILLLLLILVSNMKRDYPRMANVSSPFIYSFNVEGMLSESGDMTESSSPYWWLNSGGVMEINDNKGSTNKGELAPLSKWRLLYKISSSKDTDGGYHPQNIFRLVSRTSWKNASSEAYFKILKDNLSKSPNRNVSNGILLMLRYQDGNNLYYAGLRVDGTAIIKKKLEGEYFTLAQKTIFEGIYDRDKNPNLLPKNQWLGIKSEIKNENENVVIKLFADLKGTGKWTQIMEVIDSKDSLGREPIYESGFSGIRTDFMDVEFRDFKVREI